MRCVVQSAAGFYASKGRKPVWVATQGEAKVFRTKKMAQGVVRVLAFNKIRAKVLPLAQRAVK